MAETELDPAIHQPTRLRIMTQLERQPEISFARLRDVLGVTDGNLASHLTRLDGRGFVESRRVLNGTSFEMRYRVTAKGREALTLYRQTMRVLLAEPGLDGDRGKT